MIHSSNSFPGISFAPRVKDPETTTKKYTLSWEIFEKVLSFLSNEELCRGAQVNRSWNVAVKKWQVKKIYHCFIESVVKVRGHGICSQPFNFEDLRKSGSILEISKFHESLKEKAWSRVEEWSILDLIRLVGSCKVTLPRDFSDWIELKCTDRLWKDLEVLSFLEVNTEEHEKYIVDVIVALAVNGCRIPFQDLEEIGNYNKNLLKDICVRIIEEQVPLDFTLIDKFVSFFTRKSDDWGFIQAIATTLIHQGHVKEGIDLAKKLQDSSQKWYILSSLYYALKDMKMAYKYACLIEDEELKDEALQDTVDLCLDLQKYKRASAIANGFKNKELKKEVFAKIKKEKANHRSLSKTSDASFNRLTLAISRELVKEPEVFNPDLD